MQLGCIQKLIYIYIYIYGICVRVSLEIWFIRDLKIKKITHMSKPTYFKTSSSDWLIYLCWGDVDNYERWYKYKYCKIQAIMKRDYQRH